MSSIGGILYTKESVKSEEILAMSKTVEKKHTDASEIWVEKNVGMFCNLLWTTPESKHEILPLHDTINKYTLTANARIDNRAELIELLNISNTNSIPITDAELILQAYIKWGATCVTYLIGDFSFVLWDAKNEKLFCARDHLGIRPFYYYKNEDRFVFSSSLGAVIIGANIKKEPNITILKQILDNNIETFTSTVFKQITRLLPAHTMTVENGILSTQRYWFPEKIPMNYTVSLQEASTQFTSLMKQAVADRMRSAYPIGTELSGGFDSSTVTSLAYKQKNKQPIYVFSSTYGDLPCDESTYITDVAQKLGISPVYSQADKLDYKKYNLDYYYGIWKEYPGGGSFLDAMDEFESAQKLGVRVILTGQGGDHITTGDKFILTDALTKGNFKHLFSALSHLKWNIKLMILYMILPFLSKRTLSFLRYISKKELLPASSPYGLDPDASCNSFSQKSELGALYSPFQLLWLDSNPYVQISEYYGIDCVHPFHDKRVVEYMLSLPGWYKYDGNITRIITRESMKNLFPPSVLQRTDKAEFTPVIEKQIKSMENSDLSLIKNYHILKKGENYATQNINKKWAILCINSWLINNFK